VVADCPGFLVNRVLGPYLNEAGHLLRETGDLEGIDQALLEFGMPMGPLRLLDEVGIDVAGKAAKVLAAAYGERAAPSGATDELVAAGKLGKKSGSGFYLHEGKKAKPDPGVLDLLGIRSHRSVDRQEAVARCIYAMIAEAARCLEEEVVRGPEQLDLAMVMGTGFPPFRGGLLRYADSLGAKSVVEKLQVLEAEAGPRFRPPEVLVRKAQRGEGFYG